jgi:heme/copper-type cytochrome/quinol oxidase subunit 4
MNHEIINKMLQLVIFISVLSEQKVKKDEVTDVAKPIVESIVSTSSVISKIFTLAMTIILMYFNNEINFDIDTISQILAFFIYIYSFIANIAFRKDGILKTIIISASSTILAIALIGVIYINRQRIIESLKRRNTEQEKTQTVEQKIENKSKNERNFLSIILILTGINQALVLSNVYPIVIFILTIIRFIVTLLYFVYLKRNGKIQFDKKGIDETATSLVYILIKYISNIWDYLDSNDAYNNERNATIYSLMLLLFLFFLYGLYNPDNPINMGPIELSGF